MKRWMMACVCLVAVSSGGAVARAADANLPEPPLYALYAWASSYVQYADDAQKVGIRWVRCGGWHDTANARMAVL